MARFLMRSISTSIMKVCKHTSLSNPTLMSLRVSYFPLLSISGRSMSKSAAPPNKQSVKLCQAVENPSQTYKLVDNNDDEYEAHAGFNTTEEKPSSEPSHAVVYGVKSCTQVRDVLKKLEKANVEYVMYDYKKTIPSARLLRRLILELGVDVVVNPRSPTWKQQSQGRRDEIYQYENAAIEFMQKNVTVVKRPIIYIPNADKLGLDFRYIVGDNKEQISDFTKAFVAE